MSKPIWDRRLRDGRWIRNHRQRRPQMPIGSPEPRMINMKFEQNPLAVISRYQKTPPVDLEAVARELAIPVEYCNLGINIAGKITRDWQASPKSGFTIQINSMQHQNRQRFTLAHELAHYVLHRDLIESGVIDDTMYRSGMSSYLETQANRMAADIIMPIELVRERRQAIPSTEALASEFGVSKAAMNIRLDGL